MKSYDTVILAGGEGTRIKELSAELRKPKHLFPLGNENPTSRLARQLEPFSERIFCAVNAGQKALFQKELPKYVEVVEKTEGKPFLSDINEVLKKPTLEDLIITTGDLIFSDEEIERTFNNKLKSLQIITDSDEMLSLPMRFAILPREILVRFCEQEVNPEKIGSVLKFLFRNLVFEILKGEVGISSIKTIANLNTPDDYWEVLQNFQT